MAIGGTSPRATLISIDGQFAGDETTHERRQQQQPDDGHKKGLDLYQHFKQSVKKAIVSPLYLTDYNTESNSSSSSE